MSVFYEIKPVDTLFFRGAVPMEAGNDSAVSIFPPPVSVLEGAFRTVLLLQKGIDPDEYAKGKDTSLNSIAGNPGEKASFSVTSVLVKKENVFFTKVPQNWYLDCENKPKTRTDYIGKEIIRSRYMQDEFNAMSVSSSEGDMPFACGKKWLQPMGNIWISLDFIKSGKDVLSEKDFILQSDIFAYEHRIGIGLDSFKHTIEGQLYSASHIRLLEDVFLVVSISDDIGLSPEGKFFLGGEKRLCVYKRLEADPLKGFSSSPYYLSVVPFEATEDNLSALIASSKLTVTAGWDMAKGFHKPSTSWIPAGAVFNKNINNMCIPLAQKGE